MVNLCPKVVKGAHIAKWASFRCWLLIGRGVVIATSGWETADQWRGIAGAGNRKSHGLGRRDVTGTGRDVTGTGSDDTGTGSHVVFGGKPLTGWEKGLQAQGTGSHVVLGGGKPLTGREKDRGFRQPEVTWFFGGKPLTSRGKGSAGSESKSGTMGGPYWKLKPSDKEDAMLEKTI